MNSIDLKQRIYNDWEETNVLPVALFVYQFLIDNFDAYADQPVNLMSLFERCNVEGKKFDDIVKSFNYLAHPRFAFLLVRYQLSYNGIHDVCADELFEARQDGEFYHPETGLLVENFEEYVTIEFVLNPDFVIEGEVVV